MPTLSRSQFLRSAGAALLMLAKPCPVLAQLAQGDGIQQIAIPLQVLNTFVHRSSGLESTMRGINQKLDLIVGEIARVERALADIEIAVANLQKRMPELVSNELTSLLIDELRGSGHQWFDQGVKSIQDLGRLSQTKQNLIALIVDRLEDRIYKLATNDRGAIPRAALTAPWALAVHLNVLSLFKPDVMSAALKQHLGWHERILSTTIPGSVAYELKKLTTERDRFLDVIDGGLLGKESGFDRSSWRSTKFGLVNSCVKTWSANPDGRDIIANLVGVWKIEPYFSSGFPQIALQWSLDLKLPGWAHPDIEVPLMPLCGAMPRAQLSSMGLVPIDVQRKEAARWGLIPQFQKEVAEFIGDDKERGLLQKINDLNGRIDFLEKLKDLIVDTRTETQSYLAELGQ